MGSRSGGKADRRRCSRREGLLRRWRCARLYAEGTAGKEAYCTDFWAENYALNAQIAGLNTPYVALMDGIVMGGGVGISAHGAHRVVTERTLLAMPECGIGLVPDVGASHLLAPAPEGLARLVALTGYRLGPADCIALGLADSFVPSDRLPALTSALMEAADASPVAAFSEPPGPATLPDPQAAAEIFAGQLPEAIAERLNQNRQDWGAKGSSRNAPSFAAFPATHTETAGCGAARFQPAPLSGPRSERSLVLSDRRRFFLKACGPRSSRRTANPAGSQSLPRLRTSTSRPRPRFGRLSPRQGYQKYTGCKFTPAVEKRSRTGSVQAPGTWRGRCPLENSEANLQDQPKEDTKND